MKYLNHFNKHLGRGDRLPYSERESGNSDANAFFFLIAILANLL